MNFIEGCALYILLLVLISWLLYPFTNAISPISGENGLRVLFSLSSVMALIVTNLLRVSMGLDKLIKKNEEIKNEILKRIEVEKN